MLNTLVGVLNGGGAAGGNTSYESIATVTAAGGESSLSFSSIPSTYTHLQIRYNVRKTTSGNSDSYMRFNSDSGANYAKHWMFTFDGGGVYTSADTSTGSPSLGYINGDGTYVFNSGVIDIFDYASTTKYKTARYINGADKVNSGDLSTLLFGSILWMNSGTAINAISFPLPGSVFFAAGSTFALYGIKGS